MSNAEFIKVEPLPEGAEERLWRAVSQGQPRSEQRYRRGWVALAAAAGILGVAAAAAFTLVPSGAPSVWVGTELVTRSSARHIRLAEGTEVRLRENSSLTMLPVDSGKVAPGSNVRLELRSGHASFDVVHRPERSFVVLAGTVEVRVIGTRFTISLESPQGDVAVAVERGVVEVIPGPGVPPVRVAAGQSWTGPGLPAAPSQAPTVLPQVVSADDLRPAPGAASASAAHPSATVGGPAAAPLDEASARRLFDAANQARSRGDLNAAMRGYRDVLRRFPGGALASLAALELGRLELSHGGDAKRAAGALEQSLAADPDSPLREDTLARLVEAHARSGNAEQCGRARARYLAEFPSGLHSARVRAACAAP